MEALGDAMPPKIRVEIWMYPSQREAIENEAAELDCISQRGNVKFSETARTIFEQWFEARGKPFPETEFKHGGARER